MQSADTNTAGYDLQPAPSDDGGWYVLGLTRDDALVPGGAAVAPPPPLRPVLAKFRADGKPDAGFGLNGVRPGPKMDLAPGGVLVRSRDRLYVIVQGRTDPGAAQSLYVLAFDLDGRLYPGFGGSGVVAIATGSSSASIYGGAMSGDRLVIATTGRTNGVGPDRFMVAKFLPTGSPDSSFGTNGVVFHALHDTAGSANRLADIKVLPGGKLLVAGRARSAGTSPLEMALARLHPDGTLDTSFGNGGFQHLRMREGNNYGRRVVALANGKIILSGTTCHPYDFNTDTEDCAAGLARLHPNGVLDTTYATGGVAAFPVFPPGVAPQTVNYDLTVDRLGRAVVVGISSPVGPQQPEVDQSRGYLLRATSSGQLDTGFGDQGVALFDFGEPIASINAVSATFVGTSYRIVAAGSSTGNDGQTYLLISRHFGD